MSSIKGPILSLSTCRQNDMKTNLITWSQGKVDPLLTLAFYKHKTSVKKGPSMALWELRLLTFLLRGKPLSHYAIHILVLQSQEFDCQHKTNGLEKVFHDGNQYWNMSRKSLKCMSQDNHNLFWGESAVEQNKLIWWHSLCLHWKSTLSSLNPLQRPAHCILALVK